MTSPSNARAAALAKRKAEDRAHFLAERTIKASTPPDSWWARPALTWDQWSALADERARAMNAVTTNQHVKREQL